MVCDNNILTYAADPGDTVCGPFTESATALIASITRIEFLGFPGYHLLPQDQQNHLQTLLPTLTEIPLDEEFICRCIALRQARKIKLGDAIIAASALEYSVPVITRNASDFQNIPGLQVINPFDPTP